MSSQSNAQFKAGFQKSNLLLVDDQRSNLIALEAVLSGPDYNLILAQSGLEAIDLVKQHDIALVLLDVQMPGLDGFETARRIKALEGRRDLPIIFITAVYTEDPFIKKGYEVGGIDYFSKPFDPEILKLKVSLYAAFHQKTHLIQERENRLKETKELLKTGRKLASVLEALPIGVFIADADGRVCQVNEEVLKIWGFTGPAERESYGAFLGWWDQDGKLIKASHGPMAKALTSGESSHNELTRIQCFDGTTKSALTSASPLRSLDGKIVGVVVVIQDVTQHEQIRQDLEQHIQKLIASKLESEHTARK